MRIIGPDFETKYEPTAFVKSLKQSISLEIVEVYKTAVYADRSCRQLAMLEGISIPGRDGKSDIDPIIREDSEGPRTEFTHFVWTDDQLKGQQIIGIREFRAACFREIELVYV